jgi:hypothetical protein
MSRQYWVEPLAWATADGTAIANSTVEAIMFPDVVIPANYMQDGRTLRLRIFGKYSTVVTANPTLTFAVRWGGVSGTLLATTEALATTTTAQVNVNFAIEVYIQVRSNGAAGLVLCFGEIVLHTATSTVVSQVFGVAGYDAPAAVACNLAADAALSVTAKWSAANASNTLTGMHYTIETLN